MSGYKEGFRTTEFYLTLLIALAGVVVTPALAIIVMRGVIPQEEAQLWEVMLLAVIAVLSQVIAGATTAHYTGNRTALKRGPIPGD